MLQIAERILLSNILEMLFIIFEQKILPFLFSLFLFNCFFSVLEATLVLLLLAISSLVSTGSITSDFLEVRRRFGLGGWTGLGEGFLSFNTAFEVEGVRLRLLLCIFLETTKQIINYMVLLCLR
jgi:hypothetical protein